MRCVIPFLFLGLRICLILTYGCVSGGRVAVGGGDGCGDVVDGLFFGESAR